MEIEKKINALLAKMSVKEKVGQLNQIRSPLEASDRVFERVRNGEIGSFIMATTAYAGNDATAIANGELLHELQRVAVEESPNGIPIIFGRDIIHGHNTVSPIPIAMAAAFNGDLVETVYRDITKEAANEGVQWSFAPMLDVSRDPRWGRCIESPGEDPYLGAQVAKAVVKGFQGDDLSKPDCIAACAKHYIGYGASEGGRDYHHTEITDNSLRNHYLTAFRAAVDAGVQTVMNSFNEIGGQPTVSSRYLMTEILRDELGFDGFVVADYGAVRMQIDEGVAETRKDAAALALNAGTDMDMASEVYLQNIEACIADGSVAMETLDEAVRRILRVKFRLGLFESPYVPRIEIDKALHDKHARELSGEAIVLLKNNGALPLKKDEKLGMIGPFVHERASMLGSWCLDGKPEDVVTLIEGMSAKTDSANLLCLDNSLLDEQLLSVKQADALLVAIGESRKVTGEWNALTKLEVDSGYADLLKRAKSFGKPVIAVLCYGRPVALEEIEPYCDAIVWCWHLGTQAGNAIADVLYGDVNPSGKLPMTLPKVTGQVPLYYNALPSTHNVNGYYAERNCYCDHSNMPMYEFGYGLSYTDFAISDITVNTAEMALADIENGKSFKATVKVTNTGNISGKTVIQLYIRDVAAVLARPLRELRGFRKLEIASGEACDVTFDIGFDELAYYIGAKHLAEKGTFEISIGDSSFTTNTVSVKLV